MAGDRRAQGFAALNQLLQSELAMPAHGEDKRRDGKEQEERPNPLEPAEDACLLIVSNGHVSGCSLAYS